MFELGDSDEGLNNPEFLKVKSGGIVLIGDNEIAKVLTFIGGSRNSGTSTLFQAANVDTGEIHWVHAEEVKGIVTTRK
tara:strand:- start:234 stop:467 length:234 start_codon:yes stop_codon:yes gene_type:complete